MPFVEIEMSNSQPNKKEIESGTFTAEVLTALDNEKENNKIIWFNIPLSLTNPERYVTVQFRIDDLLEAIGKAIQRHDN